MVAASAWEDVGAEGRSVANSCPADGCKVISNVLASSQDSTNKLDLFGLLSLHRGSVSCSLSPVYLCTSGLDHTVPGAAGHPLVPSEWVQNHGSM